MKKITFLILSLFITQIASAEIALYTAESETPHSISEMGEILEKFTKDFPDKNILFYIHGRHQTVDKEWDKLPILESTYGVKVVMFHWDAWSTMTSRPVANAEVAAEPLSESFLEIRDFKESHPEFFSTHKISFLAHSMGNVVLKFFTEKFANHYQFNFDSPLFDNFVSVGADVPLKNHQTWLSRFNLAKIKNIFMNNHDIVLLLSYSLDLKNKNPSDYRLGLGLDNSHGKKTQIKSKISPNVNYIDLSGVLGSEHGYFLPKTPIMSSIFSKVTNGENFGFTESEKKALKVNVEVDQNIYYVKGK